MRKVRHYFFICFLLLPVSCHKAPQAEEVFIILQAPQQDGPAIGQTDGPANGDSDESALTKSAYPPEDRIEDINLYIFNEQGYLEEQLWIKGSELEDIGNGRQKIHTQLFKYSCYTFFACANLGYRAPSGSLEDVENLRFYLTYPDEFSHGIPMSGMLQKARVKDDTITIDLQRCMSRLEIRMDRSALYAGVEIDVDRIEIGGCPKSVSLFKKSSVRNKDDMFVKGYFRDGAPLNQESEGYLSETLYLYMLENCQGNLLDEASQPEDKVFNLEKSGELCSWVELRARYSSARYVNKPGEYLIYRFYLGESPGNFDVRRNVNYRITVRPQGSGLNEDSWRVDRSGLQAVGG